MKNEPLAAQISFAKTFEAVNEPVPPERHPAWQPTASIVRESFEALALLTDLEADIYS